MKIEQKGVGASNGLTRGSASVRAISGHGSGAGLEFATMIATPGGSAQARTLASRKPNTDPRRFVTHL